jgi:hypothetical protein
MMGAGRALAEYAVSPCTIHFMLNGGCVAGRGGPCPKKEKAIE